MLNTQLFMDYSSIKISLDSYDDIADPREHVQNVYNNLDLIIQKKNSMYKILPITFWGSTHTRYNNLEPGSIKRFSNLCAKLVIRFSTNIHAKKSFIKLFGVTQ
jgi:hypothetical protein